MSKGHLCACPRCSRHIRVTEVSCLFCGHTLSEAFRETPVPIPLTLRLSRAARYALGTGTLSLAAACGSASGLFPVLDGGQTGQAGEGGASGGGDSGYDAAPALDASSFIPPYGGFGIPDAGSVGTGTGQSEDATFQDVVDTVPYGVPPPVP